MKKTIFIAILVIFAGVLYFSGGLYYGWTGKYERAGSIKGKTIPNEIISERTVNQNKSAKAVGVKEPKQILFGDLHVHTTFSTDAFLWTLPMLNGTGSAPMADACDYARYCSGIDFWATTDHAEASTPRKWKETKDLIRQCSFASDNEESTDVISFIGFEWTQVGAFPSDHYGHKNVIFKDLEDEKVAKRPIAASGVAVNALRNNTDNTDNDFRLLGFTDLKNWQEYANLQKFLKELRDVPFCDPNLSSDQLPLDCFEQARDPGELIRRLEEQSLDPLVIPHGSSWGFYTPPTTSWDKQLKKEMRPESFPIIEVMSGHGNTEEYRSYRQVIGEIENPICPSPTDNFLPSCWRAGQIIENRCLNAGLDEKECSTRAEKARQVTANLGVGFHIAVPGENSEDYLNSGQCQDCFLPAFNHNPTTSVQYGLAITNFDEGEPINFNWGFISSSDNHRARPGTGYKPVDRKTTTESAGARSEYYRGLLLPNQGQEADPNILPLTREEILASNAGFALTELERQQSFWTQGGLAAVHSEGRNRNAIWDAMERKEIYGTSGPRILLWFDEVSNQEINPMGSSLSLSNNPKFIVKAVGSFKQKPGCEDFVMDGLPREKIDTLCGGECYNPSSERLNITRIEVIKITPQISSDEKVDDLIQDPWLVLPCDGDNGCEVEFEDPSFIENDRQSIYYVRAIQEPTDTINGDNLRCKYDSEGNCIEVNPCWGDYRVDSNDACLSREEHRAWSSPIYISKNKS